MNPARMFLVALMGLMPTTALAHGPGGHAADPNLHVDPTLEDCSVHFASNLTQGEYHRFVREFGSVSAFKLMAPPTPLGKWGVALEVEQISFDVEDRAGAWNNTFAHPDAYHELGRTQAFPKVRVRVGVSDRIDLGAFYTRNPDANYGWAGVEMKYAALQQSATMPVSVAARGAYTKTLYVDDMDMHAATLDVVAGRSFANVVTPYVGVGTDQILARETSNAVDLKTEAVSVGRALGGVEVRYWHVGLGAEAHVGALTSFQVKVAAMF